MWSIKVATESVFIQVTTFHIQLYFMLKAEPWLAYHSPPWKALSCRKVIRINQWSLNLSTAYLSWRKFLYTHKESWMEESEIVYTCERDKALMLPALFLKMFCVNIFCYIKIQHRSSNLLKRFVQCDLCLAPPPRQVVLLHAGRASLSQRCVKIWLFCLLHVWFPTCTSRLR